MTTEEDIKRIDTDVRDLRQQMNARFDTVDMRFDSVMLGIKDLTGQISEVKGKVTVLMWAVTLGLPAAMALCTFILGWILQHSKFTG